jgi:hypothetical protein
VAATLWDTSPKGSKDKSRRGATGLAEKLRLWERDIEIAFRVYELRKSDLTKDAACEKVSSEMGIGFHSVDSIAKKYRNEFLAEEAEAKAIEAEEIALAWERENEGR